jgi:TRAP-type C4-dicarboxylate transport system permease small subunit
MKWIDIGFKFVASALYMVLIGVTVGGVFFRYVLNDSLVWGEELGRYMFIWIVCIGAAIGVARDRHVNVDFVLEKLPARIRNLVELATEVGVLVFLAVVIVQGAKLTIFGLGSFSLALQIPMAWVYGALPFTAALMAVYTVRRIGRRFGLGDPPRG